MYIDPLTSSKLLNALVKRDSELSNFFAEKDTFLSTLQEKISDFEFLTDTNMNLRTKEDEIIYKEVEHFSK